MNTMLENPMVAGLDRYQRTHDLRMSRLEAAEQSLHDELQHALMSLDPERIVLAPGFGTPTTAAEVIGDDIDGKPAILTEMLRLIAQAAGGEDIHLSAAAWIAQRCAAYAHWHASDLVMQMEDDQ